VSRVELLAALPGGRGDEHAVVIGMTRLRAGSRTLVQTVVKRGCRLSLDPVTGPAPADQHHR
jgi:uroporphyrinogen-III synthase